MDTAGPSSHTDISVLLHARFLIILFCIAFAVRVAYLALVPAGEITSDPSRYLQRAESIMETGAYKDETGNPTAYEPPGTAFFLIPALFIGGGQWIIGIYYSIINSLTVLLAYFLFLRGKCNIEISRVAALILALIPSWVIHCGVASSEVPFAFFALASVVFLSKNIKPPLWFVSGVFAGAAILIRPIGVFIVPLSLFLLWREKAHRQVLRLGALLSIVGVMLVVSPWIIRNTRIMGFMGISTNQGVNFYTGNNENANGGWQPIEETLPGNLSEIERDREWSRRGLLWIKENPARWLSLLPHKMLWLWLPEIGGIVWRNTSSPGSTWTIAFISSVIWWVFSILAAMCVIRHWDFERDPVFALSVITISGISVFSLVFFGSGRFHFPAVWAVVYLGVKYVFLRSHKPETRT